MINKFQQGGQFDQIYALINQQPEQALQELVKQGLNPQQIMQLVTQGAQEGKIKPEIAQAIEKALQQQTQVARHGAKLNYIKSLKHQCAEDEEVYYFKKGGSVGCGCRKKEDGGEVTKASKGCSAVKKFKASYGTKFPESKKPNPHAPKAEKEYLALRDKDRLNQQIKKEKEEKAYQARNKKAFEEAEKLYNSGNADHTVGEERFKKPKKEKCGSKLKKHFNGGSLNRIPFLEQVLGKKE